MTEYRVNLQRYEYTAAAPGVAVFRKFIIRKMDRLSRRVEAPYFRADYVLRAMVLPAGTHTVESASVRRITNCSLR